MIKILLSRKLGELRWTQADLARKTGIRPTTINEMYHEFCERVNLEHLDLICEALDCDLDEILSVSCRKNKLPLHKRDFEGAYLSHYLGLPDTVSVEGTEEPKKG